MGNQVRPHATIAEVHQVEPWRARRKGEIGDADKIPVADAALMSLQSAERAPQQTRVYPAVDTFWPSERKTGSRRPGSNAGKRKIDKKTTRKYQDVELQRG
jgi:hypothetical protein